MKPRSPSQDAFELFQSRLDQLLNSDHPLVKLANQIDWDHVDAVFAECYCPDFGAPGKATRLMAGLHYLKHAFDESDESVVARWVENPYWQYFCGETHMQHACPIDPSSMTRWRQRVGVERLNALLKQTIETAVKQKHLPRSELEQVNVDTTVQEKNITHPKDSKLLHRAIVKLSKAAKQRGIPLRQSYVRVGRRAAVKASRYAHARQFKRMRRELRRMRTTSQRGRTEDRARQTGQPHGPMLPQGAAGRCDERRAGRRRSELPQAAAALAMRLARVAHPMATEVRAMATKPGATPVQHAIQTATTPIRLSHDTQSGLIQG